MSEQGVAQRVIAQWSREGTSFTEMYDINDGLKIMHRALSIEARRVLAELDARVETSVEDEGVALPMLSEVYAEREAACRAFQRLGLDLNEPEDSDE